MGFARALSGICGDVAMSMLLTAAREKRWTPVLDSAHLPSSHGPWLQPRRSVGRTEMSKISPLDPEAPDDQLVDRARGGIPGDMRAFELLLSRHKAHVTSNCRSLSGSPSDADDLAQEVFVKAYFALASFEGRSSFRTWIQRIKVNHCLNYLRKRKGKQFLDVDDPVNQGVEELQVEVDAEQLNEQRTEKAMIQHTLQSLPESLRIPLVMCDMDGFSYQEIADKLEIGLSATKMRIKRGREEFRRRFDRLLDLAEAEQ